MIKKVNVCPVLNKTMNKVFFSYFSFLFSMCLHAFSFSFFPSLSVRLSFFLSLFSAIIIFSFFYFLDPRAERL